MAVVLGAFGAHALRARLPSDALNVWQVAVQYHAWHALALVSVGILGFHLDNLWLRAGGWLLVAGIVLFSGSLYAIALGAPRLLGPLTPLGGFSFILGWLSLAAGVIFARTPG